MVHEAQILPYHDLGPHQGIKNASHKLTWPGLYCIPHGQGPHCDKMLGDAKILLYFVYKKRWYFVINDVVYIRTSCDEAHLVGYDGHRRQCGLSKKENNRLVYFVRRCDVSEFVVAEAHRLAIQEWDV